MDDLLNRLVRQSNEHAFVLISLAGEIMAWLGASEKVFGYTAAEIVGRSFTTLFTPEDVERNAAI